MPPRPLAPVTRAALPPRASRLAGSQARRLAAARAALAEAEARVGLGLENSRYLWEPAGTHGWGYPPPMTVFPNFQSRLPLPAIWGFSDERN
jgi:hypothetical protein